MSFEKVIIPQIKKIFPKTISNEIVSFEPLDRNKENNNEFVKLRIMTPELQQQLIERDITVCTEDNISEYTFKNEPLYNIGTGHEFINGYYVRYLDKKTKHYFNKYIGCDYFCNDAYGDVYFDDNGNLIINEF